MRTLLNLAVIAILLHFVAPLHAQSRLVIEGTVVDSATQAPVPYAHLYDERRGAGTITNIDGKFSYALNGQLPVTLQCTHIAYKTSASTFTGEQDNIVMLAPSAIALQEIVVDFRAEEAAHSIYRQLSKSPLTYGKAYYRQFTTIDSRAQEFIEIFQNIAVDESGVKGLKPAHARFARKKEGDFLFTNFPYLTFGLKLLSDGKSQLKIPFSPAIEDYRFIMARTFSRDGRSFLVVEAIPPHETTPLDHDTLWTNATFTYDLDRSRLVDYRATIHHALGADAFSGAKKDSLSAKNPRYEWYVKFSESERSSAIDYITTEYTFDLHDHEKKALARVSSVAVFYEKGLPKWKDLRAADLSLEATKNLSKLKYNARFWRDNPVIQRTAEEAALIAQFEKENAFGTYFK